MLVTMSHKEINRIDIIKDVIEKKTRQIDAARKLNMSRRNVQRLVNRYQERGVEGLVSLKRGMLSNNRYSESYRENTLCLIRENYHDFGPTFAAEKLKENDGICLSNETVRQWMIVDGLWVPKVAKRPKIHQPRPRRDCLGELIQIDGSHHDWFEGHAPKCCLLVFIDDATSRIQHLYFCESESTLSYMTATWDYIQKHGKPEALYSDKHGVFRVNHPSAKEEALTQYGRALNTLQVDLYCANSPQAKGRVERANRTFQDRLIKEMRLAGIRSIEAANQWLPSYIDKHNRRFAKVPKNSKDVHRPVRESQEELQDIFSLQDTRILSKSLTMQYERNLYLIEPNPTTEKLMGEAVIVHRHIDDSLEVKHCGRSLPCKVFDKQERIKQGAIVDSKRLGAVLDYAKKEREKLDAEETSERKETPIFWHSGSGHIESNPEITSGFYRATETVSPQPSG